MHVFRSMILNAPIDQIWSIVRKFDGVSKWNPAVAKATMETGDGCSVGNVRRLEIVDGTTFRETLLELSDNDCFYTYDILESPLPVRNYISTHRFVPITHSDCTLGIWESRFDCPEEMEEEMAAIVGDQIYINGMNGLNDFLKGC